MKKKKIIAIVIGIVSVLCLAGCGEELSNQLSSGETEKEMLYVEAEPIVDDLSSTIMALEEKLIQGEFEKEDYIQLAAKYKEKGYIKKQRDILEQGYRLERDQEYLELLDKITVNVQEESQDLKKNVELFLQNIEVEEYFNDGVSLLFSSDWFEIMRPSTLSGKRTYYQETDTYQAVIEVGYNEYFEQYTNVWYSIAEKIVVIHQREEEIQVAWTNFVDNNYQGDFQIWTCDGSTGSIFHEQGNFNKGVIDGEYSIRVREGKEALDIVSLWFTREASDFHSYKGEFDANGKTLLTQKDTLSENQILYANDEDEKKYIYYTLKEDETKDSFSFSSEILGMKAKPVYESYQIIDTSNTLGELAETMGNDFNVRVFNGMLQVYSKGIWQDVVSVKELMASDPIAVTQAQLEILEEIGKTSAQEREQTRVGDKNIGVVKSTTTTTQKPNTSTSKPTTSTSKPTTQTQTPETNNQNQESNNQNQGSNNQNQGSNNQNQGSNNQNQDSNNQNQGSNNPTPDPTPPAEESIPDSNSGNDVDTEFSDDIL